jgi:hypothetical protein
MTKQALAAILVQLHDELHRTQKLDDADRLAMQELVGEIQSALERDEELSEQETLDAPAISKRLEDSILSFEAHHPKLTSILSQIADRLADMGI